MTLEEIKTNLCIYDTRNPDHKDVCDDWTELPEPRLHCCCDNCFYGRDKLAVEILTILGLEE